MKTCFIFLYLLIGAIIAKGTIQTSLSQYKPDRFYIKSYSATQTGTVFEMPPSQGFQANYTFSESYQDGSNGTFIWNSVVWHPPSGHPGFINPNPAWTSTISANGTTYFAGGSVTSNFLINTASSTIAPTVISTNPYYAPAFPGLFSENGSFSTGGIYSFTGGGSGNCTVNRSVTTIVKLQTGGKPNSTTRNLFEFSEGSYSAFWQCAIPFDNYDAALGNLGGIISTYPPSGVTPIPPQNIAIGAFGHLNTNGYLFHVFADNADVVVTPTTGGYYTWSVGEQKFRAFIQANNGVNNVILHSSYVAPNASFCVGQNIQFSIAWSPYTPTAVFYNPNTPLGIASSTYLWYLPGSYVNNYQVPDPPSTASTTYFVEQDFLTDPTTSCWYINSPGGTASVGVNLVFSDGEQAVITARGQFSIFRPTVTGLTAPGPFYAALVPTTNNPNELQLGNNLGGGGMGYTCGVASAAPFYGEAGLVQLVNKNDILTMAINQQTTTYGQYWLDNTYFYDSNNLITASYNYRGGLELTDQPGYGLEYLGIYGSSCSINDSFEDYVVFNPDTPNSIYVTLGRIFWSWQANSTNNNGIWSNPSYSVIGPSEPDNSDEFPSYPQTYINNTH